jgi:hypothetical protein
MDKTQIIAYLNFLRDDLTNKDEIIDYCINQIKEEIESNEKDNWIKIENEDDLPKENIDCFYLTKHGDYCIGRFVLEHFRGWKRMFTIDGVIAVGFGYVTHYQRIIKPDLPQS